MKAQLSTLEKEKELLGTQLKQKTKNTITIVETNEKEVWRLEEQIRLVTDENKSLHDKVEILEKQIITLKEDKELKSIKLDLTSEEIEQNLRNWAYESGFTIKDNPHELARFSFVIIDQSKIKVTVINMKKNEKYRIFMTAKLNISEDQKKLFNEMSQEEKFQFTSHIKLELLRLGIGYKFDWKKHPFKNIMLTDEFVYDKSLTRTIFLKSYCLFVVQNFAY